MGDLRFNVEFKGRKLFLLGSNIGYSVSPAIYNRLFNRLGVDLQYQILDVPEEQLKTSVERLREGDVVGFNVTIPYKTTILSFLDEICGEAGDIGAVNICINDNGKLVGYNTDWRGFRKALENIGKIRYVEKAVIIGAGGAGRAAVYALRGICNKLVICSRSGVSAEKLAVKARSWNIPEVIGLRASPQTLIRESRNASLIVNATPIGSIHVPDNTPIPVDVLEPPITVFDMVYNPLKTRLLAEAEKKSCTTIDGLWMLVYQAIENLKLWLRLEVEPLELRRYGVEALEAGRSG